MPGELIHLEKSCGDALGRMLSVYPYDSCSKFARNDGFSPEDPNFMLERADDVENDVVSVGTGGTCITLPEILKRRLQTMGLEGRLIADRARRHVVLCLQEGDDKVVICDPGLLCVKPFVVTPERRVTDVFEVDNPGKNDKFGFTVEFKPDTRSFTISKTKARSGLTDVYEFDMDDLGDAEQVVATDKNSTLDIQIPLVARLIAFQVGRVVGIDSITARDKPRTIREFAVRNGIEPEELVRRVTVGNRVRRKVQAFSVNGGQINWI